MVPQELWGRSPGRLTLVDVRVRAAGDSRQAEGADQFREVTHATSTPTHTGEQIYLRQNFMGIRTADALYCFFGRNAFGGPVAVSIHSFDGLDADATKQKWQRWLAKALA